MKKRVYNCQNCGHSMDRDLNAAIILSRLAKP
ncbi:zinc ribbon domain-containing protein [Nodularia chucula]